MWYNWAGIYTFCAVEVTHFVLLDRRQKAPGFPGVFCCFWVSERAEGEGRTPHRGASNRGQRNSSGCAVTVTVCPSTPTPAPRSGNHHHPGGVDRRTGGSGPRPGRREPHGAAPAEPDRNAPHRRGATPARAAGQPRPGTGPPPPGTQSRSRPVGRRTGRVNKILVLLRRGADRGRGPRTTRPEPPPQATATRGPPPTRRPPQGGTTKHRFCLFAPERGGPGAAVGVRPRTPPMLAEISLPG